MKNLKIKKEFLGTSINFGKDHLVLSLETEKEVLKKISDLPSLSYLVEEIEQKSKDKKVKDNE
jgi:hypothetical protein